MRVEACRFVANSIDGCTLATWLARPLPAASMFVLPRPAWISILHTVLSGTTCGLRGSGRLASEKSSTSLPITLESCRDAANSIIGAPRENNQQTCHCGCGTVAGAEQGSTGSLDGSGGCHRRRHRQSALRSQWRSRIRVGSSGTGRNNPSTPVMSSGRPRVSNTGTVLPTLRR